MLSFVMLVALIGMGFALAGALHRIQVLEKRLDATPKASAPLLEPAPPSALAGKRIGLAIRQDHPHPLFATLLSEQLLRIDAAGVEVVEGAERDFDLVIEGSVTCNGYAEVYYQAEFNCSTGTGALCTVIEKPPGGDRPANLAMELIAKLEAKLGETMVRSERSRALRELGG